MKINHKVWMVRSGRGSYLVEDFLNDGIIAIGWNDLGDLTNIDDYNVLKQKFKDIYTYDSVGRVNQCVGQIWRFLTQFKISDKVVTYDSIAREYYLGTITSEYTHSEKYEYHNFRTVDWMDGGVSRDKLSPDTKNTLGAISTIFELSNEVWDELTKNHPGYVSEEELDEIDEVIKKIEEEDLKSQKDDIIFRSQEYIKDIISRLSWQDTELLVSGLLKSMGYNTRFTSKGGDLGSDIIASPDALGLEEPLIKVEVKKRTNEKIGADLIRSFIGGLRGHYKGIFVTTTGFSKEAVYEAERANFAITLIDSNWLVELLVANYERLDPEIKSLVPLRKIYWPV